MKTRRLLFTIALALGLTLSWLWLLGGNLPYVRAAGYTVDNIGDSGSGSLRQAINSANGSAEHDTITFTANVSGAIVLASDLPAIVNDLTITGPGAEVLAVSGAGAHRVFSITQGVAVTITGLTVRDGYADGNGGGIWTAGSLSLDSVHVMNNVVTDTYTNDADYHGYGSGLYVYTGSVTLSQTQVFSNVANRGGGLYIKAGSVTMNGAQVFNNAASPSGGGGLYVDQGSVTLLSETQVFNNNAAFNGGGLYVYQGSASLSETQVFSNVANSGGGLCVSSNSTATLSETQVFSNVADDSGGGLCVSSNSTATLSGTQILSNTAPYGGGIHTEGDLSMDGGEIAGNVASGGMHNSGGGLHVYGGDAGLNGVRIFGNTATSGGGVDVSRGSVTLSGTQVFSNTALAGGGLAAGTTGRMILNGTRVFSNTGCGLEVDGASSVTLNRTQIRAYGDAEAIRHDGGTITTTSALTIVGDIQLRYDARFVGSDHNLQIDGALDLQAGEFYAPEGPTSTLTLTGPYTHTGGTYRQIQPVNGSDDIGFPSNKAGSVSINANNQDLGRTEVVDIAGEACPGVPAGEAVAHCYIITPTVATGRAATVTFFYQREELPPFPSGYSCTTIEAYRWTGAWDTMLTRDTSYGDSGWLCDSGDPQSIRVAGVDAFGTFALHQPAREIAVVPLALDFGKQVVDIRGYPSQTVTITNKGLGDLHITDIELTGNDPEQFYIVSGGGDVKEIVVEGYTTHTVQVSFHPTRTGVMSAFLSVYSDDTDEPTVTVALSGTAVGVAKIGIKPYQLDFGEQDVDAGPTASQTVNITNTGELDLHITNIELIGLHAANYSIESGGNPVTLTSNSKHTVQVSFDPMSTGVLSMAALRIDSDASNNAPMGWTMVTLTGTGTGIVPTYTLTLAVAGGQGTVTPLAGDHVYEENTVVPITATAASGWHFDGWLGNVADADAVTTTVTMDADKVVTATFAADTTCTAITDVTLTVQTTGAIYTDTLVQFAATLSPNDATPPYSYTLDFGEGIAQASEVGSANPLTFTHTYATPGAYTVTLAIENCDMPDPFTRTVTVTVLADTTPPDPPTITAPISGTTTGGQPPFTGSGEPGGTLKVYDEDHTVVCTTTVAADGRWSCTPSTPLPAGPHTYTITVTDAAGNESDPATVVFTVDLTVNNAPLAVDDAATVPEQVPAWPSTVLEVLENDSDPDGDAITITQVSVPGHGTATTDGATVTYTPTVGYIGTDNFTYTLSDGELEAAAHVTLTVLPVADLAVTQRISATLSGYQITIIVRNLGPRDVVTPGAVLSDTFAAALGNIQWECAASGGAVCPRGGEGTLIGNLHEALTTFPADSTLIYTIDTSEGTDKTVWNTVTVTAPATMFDVVPDNNRASHLTAYRIILPLIYKNAQP